MTTAWILLSAGLGFAGGFGASERGTSAASFLRLGPDARAAALAGAYTAAADEASAVTWNPANLAEGPQSAVAMHAAHLGSSFFDYAAYRRPMGEGGIGLAVQYFSTDRLTQTDDTGTEVGGFRPNDLAVSLAGAASDHGVSIGLAVKLIRSEVLEPAYTGAVDAGVSKRGLWGGRLSLGATLTNLGGRLKFERESEPLPFALRLGAALRPARWWLASVDVAFPRDDSPQAAAGTEISTRRLSLRAGYATGLASGAGGLRGASFGGGLPFGPFRLDYAWLPFGGLGSAHRVSLSWTP